MLDSRTRLATTAFILSLLSSVSAQDSQYPEPITLGMMGYPHGHQMLAWSPTRTSMVDACNGNDQPSRTVIQVDNSGYPSNPICNHVFSLDGYDGLELLCAGNETEGVTPQITGIATNGTRTHACTALPFSSGFYSTPCDETHITSISQSFACQ